MGEVYLARHAMLRRPTAVKLLRPELLTTENLARFEREVQLTSELTHPNTIEVYDYGHTPEDVFYYAMEYLRGITLAKLIQIEGPVPPARVVHILKQVCGSLEEAHAIGLVHRDIKPANIMLCRRGVEADVAKVLDFGLVKDVVKPETIDVTAQNIVGGTPAYIAPERLKNPEHVDARVDLYALGAVAFNLLTGQELYTGNTPADIGYQALFADVPRPSERADRAIPPALDDLVFACLSKDPDDRPSDAGEMLRRLEAIVLEEPWTRDDARAWWDARPELAAVLSAP
jgi:serine/threonine-protein kinase